MHSNQHKQEQQQYPTTPMPTKANFIVPVFPLSKEAKESYRLSLASLPSSTYATDSNSMISQVLSYIEDDNNEGPKSWHQRILSDSSAISTFTSSTVAPSIMTMKTTSTSHDFEKLTYESACKDKMCKSDIKRHDPSRLSISDWRKVTAILMDRTIYIFKYCKNHKPTCKVRDQLELTKDTKVFLSEYYGEEKYYLQFKSSNKNINDDSWCFSFKKEEKAEMEDWLNTAKKIILLLKIGYDKRITKSGLEEVVPIDQYCRQGWQLYQKSMNHKRFADISQQLPPPTSRPPPVPEQ